MTLRVFSSKLTKNQSKQIIILSKKMIVLKSDREYIAHALFKKDVDLEMLCDKVKNLGCYTIFLKASLKEKKDLMRALG